MEVSPTVFDSWKRRKKKEVKGVTEFRGSVEDYDHWCWSFFMDRPQSHGSCLTQHGDAINGYRWVLKREDIYGGFFTFLSLFYFILLFFTFSLFWGEKETDKEMRLGRKKQKLLAGQKTKAKGVERRSALFGQIPHMGTVFSIPPTELSRVKGGTLHGRSRKLNHLGRAYYCTGIYSQTKLTTSITTVGSR